MQRYANLSGTSSVVAFENKRGAIVVQFPPGRWTDYEYTDASAGAANIVTMQSLAVAGRGLGTFIQAHVAKRYERKW